VFSRAAQTLSADRNNNARNLLNLTGTLEFNHSMDEISSV
jgi:hypothetical protein